MLLETKINKLKPMYYRKLIKTELFFFSGKTYLVDKSKI